MDNHPTKRKLELFLLNRLPGEEAVEILLHLDECEICRNLLPDETAQEVIENLLKEDEEQRHCRKATFK